MFAFAISCLLKIFNASFSSSLNRLSALSLYPKFVPIDNSSEFNFYLAKLCNRDEHCSTASLIKVPPLKVGVHLILEVHNTLFKDPTYVAKMNGKLNVKPINNFDHAPLLSSIDQ